MVIKESGYSRSFFVGLLAIFIVGHLSAIQTRLKIRNLSDSLLKIERTEKVLVLTDGTRLQDPIRRTSENAFLGAYAPLNKKTGLLPMSFDWIERGIAWERYLYRISQQNASAGFPIDLLFEWGSGWSFLLAKSGGEWQNLSARQAATVGGTNLWIKAGATALTIDTPERTKMQVGPHLTCQLSCIIEGLEQNYILTIADDGDPAIFAQRLLEPSSTTVLLENQTASNWRITVDGVTPQKKHINLGPKEINAIFSLAPDPTKRALSNDTITVALVAPHNSSYRNFYLIFKRAKTDAEPQLFIGPTPYRVSQNLFVPGIFIQVTRSAGQIRYSITTDAAVELKRELIDAIREHHAGRLATPLLKDKIVRILAAAPEKLALSPLKLSLEEFRKTILNVLDDQGMTPVLWFGNNREMVDFLAEQGADLTVQDNQLLYFAIGAQAPDVILDLIGRKIVPAERHLSFARSVSPAIAQQLVTALTERMIAERSRPIFEILLKEIAASRKAGDIDFATWASYYLQSRLAQACRSTSPANVELALMLKDINNQLVSTVSSCTKTAKIELQNQREDFFIGVEHQNSLVSHSIAPQGTSGYTSLDTICFNNRYPSIPQLYTLICMDQPFATIHFIPNPDGSLSAEIWTGDDKTRLSGLQQTVQIGDRELRFTVVVVVEGGITKGKIYIEQTACPKSVFVELINQRWEFAVWAESILADGQRGTTVGMETNGSKKIDSICIPPVGGRHKAYRIFIFSTQIAVVNLFTESNGTLAAEIRTDDNKTILQNSRSQGWTMAWWIGRGIRIPFTIPGNTGSLTIEAINNSGFKIYIQVPGLPQ